MLLLLLLVRFDVVVVAVSAPVMVAALMTLAAPGRAEEPFRLREVLKVEASEAFVVVLLIALLNNSAETEPNSETA